MSKRSRPPSFLRSVSLVMRWPRNLSRCCSQRCLPSLPVLLIPAARAWAPLSRAPNPSDHFLSPGACFQSLKSVVPAPFRFEGKSVCPSETSWLKGVFTLFNPLGSWGGFFFLSPHTPLGATVPPPILILTPFLCEFLCHLSALLGGRAGAGSIAE